MPEDEIAGVVELPDCTLEQLERAAIEQSLARHGGNMTRAARERGISTRSIKRKLVAWSEADKLASRNPDAPAL